MKTIGITSTVEERKNALNMSYINAFSNSATVPLIIPSFVDETAEFVTTEKDQSYKDKAKEIEAKIDALVLSGGGDINPIQFRQNNLSSCYCNSRRDLSEIYLINRFIEAKKPIMGICRGFQILGIMLDLPNFMQEIGDSEELHNGNNREMTSRKEFSHFVSVRSDLEKMLLETGKIVKNTNKIPVNSLHHQGFAIDKDGEIPDNIDKRIGEIESKTNLTILANSGRLIEAFQHKTLPIFAVQWHPEEYGNESVIIDYFLEKYVFQLDN